MTDADTLRSLTRSSALTWKEREALKRVLAREDVRDRLEAAARRSEQDTAEHPIPKGDR